jgi:hypothetical protein
MKVVSENNRAQLNVRFYDLDGALAAPISVEYRIDDEASGDAVRDWTELAGPMASAMAIPLTSLDNALVDPQAQSERRTVTVRADYDGTDDENYATGAFTYEVANLRFLQ